MYRIFQNSYGQEICIFSPICLLIQSFISAWIHGYSSSTLDYNSKLLRPGFDPSVGESLCRRERLPTPGFWPREFHGEVRGVAKSWTRKEQLSLYSLVWIAPALAIGSSFMWFLGLFDIHLLFWCFLTLWLCTMLTFILVFPAAGLESHFQGALVPGIGER